MNENEIVELYNNGYTLRHISEIFNSNHHTIKRILLKNKVEITKRKTKKPYTDEHRKKIGATSKGRVCWAKGLKMDRAFLLKNMKAHLKYDVSLEWLEQFENVEKLKFLNKAISRKRDYNGFNTEIYISFIEKFYNDEKFNILFDRWFISKNILERPSLDHKHPKSKGGKLTDINNLQFITWLENRAKANIDFDTWNDIKQRIHDFF